jgi:tetratricopeptide (TPR) repeat protein
MDRATRRRLRKASRRLASAGLGMLVTFVLAELLLALGTRAFVHVQLQRNLASIQRQDGAPDDRPELRILCIGESTTAVAGDERGTMLVPRTAYPVQLERILNERQQDIRYTVLNNGIMGGTSGSSLELLGQTLPTLQPHIIIAMMGIKDTPTEWTPFSLPLPDWMLSLNTVTLLTWLIEDAELESKAMYLDIRRFEELPEIAQARYMRAPNQIQELSIAHNPDAISRVQAAAYLLHIGQLSRAEDRLREVIAEHGQGYSMLGEVLATAGRDSEATALLTHAVTTHPEEGMYAVRLAHFLSLQGHPERAHGVLDAAEANLSGMLEPEIVLAYIRLERAELLLAEKDWDGVLSLLEGPVSEVGSHYFAVVPSIPLLTPSARGRAYLGLQNWTAAEAQFVEALEVEPGRHVNMWLLSEVYRQTGQADKEEALRWSLIAKEGRVAEYFELAKLFRLTGHPEREPEVLAQAVAATPSLEANHQALYDIAQSNGIQLIVMQYPSFGLAPVHLYAPEAPGVVFIDNEHVFDADPEGYFFKPTYPQSFTHYTNAGAEVLAAHVADTVLALPSAP